jgi:hypothetical protein
VEAGELGEKQLHQAENHHVRAPRPVASRHAESRPVKAVHPLHRATHKFIQVSN